jgi:hypothetical protein
MLVAAERLQKPSCAAQHWTTRPQKYPVSLRLTLDFCIRITTAKPRPCIFSIAFETYPVATALLRLCHPRPNPQPSALTRLSDTKGEVEGPTDSVHCTPCYGVVVALRRRATAQRLFSNEPRVVEERQHGQHGYTTVQ